MTKEEKIYFKSNLKAIIENYKVLKYWSKYGTNILVKDEHYDWKWFLNSKQPTLSDICKHLIYSWCRCSCIGNRLKKYEMIPSKWNVKQAYCFLSIVKHENVDDNSDYEELFKKYKGDELYTNAKIFESDFKEFVERYANNLNIVKLLEKPLTEKELLKYKNL